METYSSQNRATERIGTALESEPLEANKKQSNSRMIQVKGFGGLGLDEYV